MLSWIRQLAKMPAEKLADKLAHFEYLLDISGLADRAKSAQRMDLGDDGADKDEKPAKPAKDGKGNVTKFPAATAPA